MISTIVAQLCPSRSLPTCFLPNRGRSLRSVQLHLPALSTAAALIPTVLDARTWEDADQGVVVVDTPRWAWIMWRAAGRGKCHTKGNSLKLLSWLLLFFWGGDVLDCDRPRDNEDAPLYALCKYTCLELWSGVKS